MCQASPRYNSCPHGGLREGAHLAEANPNYSRDSTGCTNTNLGWNILASLPGQNIFDIATNSLPTSFPFVM